MVNSSLANNYQAPSRNWLGYAFLWTGSASVFTRNDMLATSYFSCCGFSDSKIYSNFWHSRNNCGPGQLRRLLTSSFLLLTWLVTLQHDIGMAEQFPWCFPGQMKQYFRTQNPEESLVPHPVTHLSPACASTHTPKYPWSSITLASCFGILENCYSHGFHYRVLFVFVFCSQEHNNASRIVYVAINSNTLLLRDRKMF